MAIIGCVAQIVKNSQGNSLDNVSVSSFEMQNDTVRRVDIDKVITSDGLFETVFIGTVPKTSWLVFEKKGFKTIKKDLVLENEKVNTLEVVMEKN